MNLLHFDIIHGSFLKKYMSDLNELSSREITKYMSDLPGWNMSNNTVFKEYIFRDFISLINFIYSLAAYFEETNHHPDMVINYNKILFELTTHKLQKLTALDFMVAKEIESRFNAL